MGTLPAQESYTTSIVFAFDCDLVIPAVNEEAWLGTPSPRSTRPPEKKGERGRDPGHHTAVTVAPQPAARLFRRGGSYTDIYSLGNVAITASTAVIVVGDPATAGGWTSTGCPRSWERPADPGQPRLPGRHGNTITVSLLDGVLTVSVDGTQVVTTSWPRGPRSCSSFPVVPGHRPMTTA
jgi:hypothetical protein